MTDQIQLSEICGYLPWRLKMLYEHTGKIGELTGINDLPDYDTVKLKNGWDDSEHIWMYKPLLIPLEKLILELAEWLLQRNPILKTAERATALLSVINTNVNETPLFIAQEIYKRHGDLHNLIGRGLAIDKTLNNLTP